MRAESRSPAWGRSCSKGPTWLNESISTAGCFTASSLKRPSQDGRFLPGKEPLRMSRRLSRTCAWNYDQEQKNLCTCQRQPFSGKKSTAPWLPLWTKRQWNSQVRLFACRPIRVWGHRSQSQENKKTWMTRWGVLFCWRRKKPFYTTKVIKIIEMFTLK